jgi:hypothetical protein
VTQTNVFRSTQDPAWQLLAEFSLPGEPGKERQSAQQFTRGLGNLGMQLAQVERIRKAVVEAVRDAKKRADRDQESLPISVRLYVSAAFMDDLSRSNPDAQQEASRGHPAWGFFLIQRRGGNPQSPDLPSQHLIELFLYQEGEH